MTKYAFREIVHSHTTSDKTFSQLVLSVYDCLCESVHRCDMMFQHILLSATLPFSLPPSSVVKSLPLSPLSYSMSYISFPFSLPVVSYGFQTFPLISVHPLHFDVRPHTATLTTTKTRPLLALYLSLALCLSSNLSCSTHFSCPSFFAPFYSSIYALLNHVCSEEVHSS